MNGCLVDTNIFNPNNKCCKGGMYFTTIDNIFKFITYGCYFCEIQLDDDSRCYVEDDKIKTNKFTIKNMVLVRELKEWYDNDFCLNAVKQYGLSLRHVKNQTEEICLEAVKKEGYALQHVKKQTNTICLESVKNYGGSLQYVKNQTEEICLEAVKQIGHSLKHVETQTEEMCIEAVKYDGYILMYVKNQTEKICLEAVKQKGFSLQFVDVQTEEICAKAIEQNKNSKIWIRIEPKKEDKSLISSTCKIPCSELKILNFNDLM